MEAVFVYFQVMVEHLSLGGNKNHKKILVIELEQSEILRTC